MPAKFFRNMSEVLVSTKRQTGGLVRRSRGALRACSAPWCDAQPRQNRPVPDLRQECTEELGKGPLQLTVAFWSVLFMGTCGNDELPKRAPDGGFAVHRTNLEPRPVPDHDRRKTLTTGFPEGRSQITASSLVFGKRATICALSGSSASLFARMTIEPPQPPPVCRAPRAPRATAASTIASVSGTVIA